MILKLILFNIFIIFIISFKHNRLIITHHKTGTMLARKLKTILLSNKPNINKLTRQYSIATIGDGLQLIGMNEKWTNIVHLMRNPFSMILSSYYYHMNTNEQWVHCSINYQYYNPLCPFKSKYNTILKTINYIQNNLKNELNLTSLYINNGISIINTTNLGYLSGKNHNNNINNHNELILKFPPTTGHTYQTYLNILPPLQGIIVEMIRVNYHDIPSMIDDFFTMSKTEAYYTAPNLYNSNVPRKYVSICLETLTSMKPDGRIVNSEEGIKRILDNLDIVVPPEDMFIILEWVNHDTELHQTNHTGSSRSQVEAFLRWYDKNRYNGLLHYFEKLIMCGNIGGTKHNSNTNTNNNNNTKSEPDQKEHSHSHHHPNKPTSIRKVN